MTKITKITKMTKMKKNEKMTNDEITKKKTNKETERHRKWPSI